MSDLDFFVSKYLSIVPRCGCEDELDLFANLGLEEAISFAALSVFPVFRKDRKIRHGHQRRLRKWTLSQAEMKLQNRYSDIEKCKEFDELHVLVESEFRSIEGAGELYAYDVAHRIGHSMGLAPDFVYLHSGTRVGARNLGIRGHKARMDQFPQAMQCLTPEQAEDFLCIYKDELAEIGF